MRIVMKITCTCGRKYEVDNFNPSRDKFLCPNCNAHPDSESTNTLMQIMANANNFAFSSSENSSKITAISITVLDD